LPPANLGRADAAYGGVLILLSILWGWKVDGIAPDRFDPLGAGIIAVVTKLWAATSQKACPDSGLHPLELS